MSDNEYERFEITDYDLDNEFNINRPRRRQTKHQQIYGIWADDSDNDSEGETSGRRGRRGLGGGSSSKPKDYTAPVNFVAGGIQQAGKKSKIKQLDDGKDVARSDDSDDSDEARPSFGDKQPQLMDNNEDNSTDSSEAEERKEHQQMRSKSFAGMRHNSHIPSGRNVGAWEQHTRGIGAKLLLQMGYEPGKGLGKDLQGIQQPVQAHVRKGRGAIGAYGPETAASIGGQAKPQKEDEDVKEAREFKEQLTKWKKGGVEPREKSKPQRYYYKSVEEVIAKSHKSDHLLSEKLAKQLGNVPVIDMTGPERRVLSGYHALAQTKITPEESLYDEQGGEGKDSSISIFSMPELAHNMALLVSQCEQEIILIDKAKRESEDQQAALEQEQRQLLELVHLERNHMNTLNEVLSRLDQLSENPDLTMTQAEDLFVELQRNYPAEFEEYGMADMAGGVIAPLLRRELADWQPLEQPTLHLEMMKRWRTILQKDEEQLHHQQQQQQSRNVFDPYSSLVWAGVMPSIRTSALAWPPKKHAIMAAFLDAWAPVLPTWVLDSILEKLVLTRLRVGVQEWDPLTDTVPIHSWILPWHGLLGGKLEETVYPQIRSKLGAALEAWLPQDRSARAMLTPWQTAFPEEQLIQFLLRHIIPKLQAVLGEFIINPLQQDLELWHQVWEWNELIPPAYMAQLLDKYFFPRWMQVLVMWLNQSPDYAEISRWYAGWKSMFSESILREPCIKEHLRRALDMLHRATDAVLQPTVVPPPPMPPVPAPVLLAPVMLVDVGSSAQLEFKELVSQKCAELGIIFAPLPGRRELGKQIYRVGKLFCYIDRNVCMMTNASFQNWQPVSLNQLLEQAQTGII